MSRPYFLDEVARDFQLWFEVLDGNTSTEPADSGHEPKWKYEDEWDDDFKEIWRWAGNHGWYDGGQWEIAHDHPDDAWVHQYTYNGQGFLDSHPNTDFWRLIWAIQNTSKHVGARVTGELGEYDNYLFDELEEDVEEKCWQVENQISYHLSLIGDRKEHYVAYELKGLPAERNRTVIIKQGNHAFFVGHKRRISDFPSEEAKVLRGEIRDDQVIPERPQKEFAVESTSPGRIYDIAEEIFASHETEYMEENK